MTAQTVLTRSGQTASRPAARAEFRGMPDVREVDLHTAAHMIEAIPDLIVLDVRMPPEVSEARLQQSLNIDFYADDFEHLLAGLDRQACYLVYCRSGGRSAHALDLMEELGFARAVHMPAGIEGWRAEGLPVVTD